MKRVLILLLIIGSALLLSGLGFLYYPFTEPEVSNVVDRSKVGKIKKVVVLSNSILHHPPLPEIGWYGNWGMAASSPDSDFYHLLIRDIHAKDSTVVVDSAAIGSFERHYPTFELSLLKHVRGADMYIIRLSENVDDRLAVQQHFIDHYDRLVRYLDPDRKAVVVIVEGFWKKGYRWPQPWVKADVNAMIRDYAISHRYPFIKCAYLFKEKGNNARGLYQVYGVSNHPSDQGMRRIEENIWNYISAYF
jgi:hypothetical protein